MAISTHVLDTTRGTPAAGVSVALALRGSGGTWKELSKGVTDDAGRYAAHTSGGGAEPGVYRLIFDVGAYQETHRTEAFFPEIAVEFIIREAGQKFHVPLLISPFGYSTYRGS